MYELSLPHRYRVYGLSVASELPLPELEIERDPDLSADVVIRRADSQESNGGPPGWPWFERAGESIVVRAGALGSFDVRAGREILVRATQPGEGTGIDRTDADRRLFLLGSALGALLHQRGVLPLHVGSVEHGGAAWAFTGASGEGKSTITAWLHRELGMRLVSDDVAALDWRDGTPRLLAGPRRIKLWGDALSFLGCDDSDRVQDLSGTNKYQLLLDRSSPSPAASRMRALVVLSSAQEGSAPVFERLRGGRAFLACRDAVYRPEIAALAREPGDLMQDLARLAGAIDIYLLRRPRGLDGYAEALAPLLDAMGLPCHSRSVIAGPVDHEPATSMDQPHA